MQVIEVTTSKTGKHGHAKCNFVAIDIFNGKKMEDMCPSSHNVDIPNIKRTEFLLLDVGEDGFVSLMNEETGDTREDLQLPSGNDDLDKLANDIKTGFNDGKDVRVVVVGAMDEEQIQSFKLQDA